jgi:hypothetical protein
MNADRLNRWQAASLRCYRVLLRAYPREFLNQYEEQLDQSFRDLAREQISRHRMLGLFFLWTRVLPDLVFTVVRQRAAGISETQSAVFLLFVLWVLPFALVAPVLLLLACLFAAGVMLVLALLFAIQGKRDRAFRTMRRLGIGTATYMGALLVIPFMSPVKTVLVGESFCPDAVCIKIENVARSPLQNGFLYNVTVRATSNSRKPLNYTEQEWMVHLDDGAGRRFPSVDPTPISGFVLSPAESKLFAFAFAVPADAQQLFFDSEETKKTFFRRTYTYLALGSGELVHRRPVRFQVQN